MGPSVPRGMPSDGTVAPSRWLTLGVAHCHFVLSGTGDTGPAQPHPPAQILDETEIRHHTHWYIHTCRVAPL